MHADSEIDEPAQDLERPIDATDQPSFAGDRGVYPQVVIVGRPNVGKSTIFNWLVEKRIAIEDPTEGVTRDRLVQRVRLGESSRDTEGRVVDENITGFPYGPKHNVVTN